MPLVLTTYSPAPLVESGGQRVTLGGGFPVGVPIAVHLGTAATTADLACHGGPGNGYGCFSTDGLTLRCWTPPAEVGAVSFSAHEGGLSAVLAATVIERSFDTRLWAMRRMFAPALAVGPRRAELEARTGARWMELLHALVWAIAEGDSELGGQLATRLRCSHPWGGNDGVLELANPTQLKVARAVFAAAHVDLLVDLLSPAAHRGTYQISVVVSSTEVTLVHAHTGGVVAFTDAADVQWRLASLHVESADRFSARALSPLMRVHVAGQAAAFPYQARELVPTAQTLLGLGSWVGGEEGAVRLAVPQRIDLRKEGALVAGDVGRALWLLPSVAGSTANAGLRKISAVVSGAVCDFTGPALTVDEVNVAWRMGQYLDDGYLGSDAPEGALVLDVGGGWSGTDRLRRELQVPTASDEGLTRLGRLRGLDRPRGLGAEQWRRVLQCLPAGPKGTIFMLELLLQALYPQGGWRVRTSAVRFPCRIYLDTPELEPGTEYEGRAYLPARQTVTSAAFVDVALAVEPRTVESVRCADLALALDMDALPSAAPVPWTYVAEGGGVEGAVFSIVSGALVHDMTGGILAGGRYQYLPTWVGEAWTLGIWWQAPSGVITAGGLPWKLTVRDGAKECTVGWSDTTIAICTADEVSTWASVAITWTAGQWYRVVLGRADDEVYVEVGGQRVLSFSYSGVGAWGALELAFGYFDCGNLQDWLVRWDTLRFRTSARRNYWNCERTDGVMANPDSLTSAAAPFLAADVMVATHADLPENRGTWLCTFIAPGAVTLAGIPRAGAAVSGQTGVGDGAIIELDDPLFRDFDDTKQIGISGSLVGNNGVFPVEAILSPTQARVTYAGGFVTESNLTWEFVPDFTAEVGVRFEIVGTGVYLGPMLTLRDPLPAAATKVDVDYTTVPSGQTLRDESVANLTEAVGVPDLYYPLYLVDVLYATKVLVDEARPAGYLPRYRGEMD